MMVKNQPKLTVQLLVWLAEGHSGTQWRSQPSLTTYMSTVQNEEMLGTSSHLSIPLLQLPLAHITHLDPQKLGRCARINGLQYVIVTDHHRSIMQILTWSLYWQLKKLYTMIEVYTCRSGMHCDSQHGANIVGSNATSVWDDHIGKKVW